MKEYSFYQKIIGFISEYVISFEVDVTPDTATFKAVAEHFEMHVFYENISPRYFQIKYRGTELKSVCRFSLAMSIAMMSNENKKYLQKTELLNEQKLQLAKIMSTI